MKYVQESSPASRDYLKEIDSPVKALGLLLVVLEAGLVAWFFVAATSAERTVAGALFVAVLLASIAAIVLMHRSERLRPQSPGVVIQETRITTANAEASPFDARLQTSRLVGPNKDYTIVSPPPGWTSEVLSSADLQARRLQIQRVEDADLLFDNALRYGDEVLTLASPVIFEYEPQIGNTKLFNRPYDAALSGSVRLEVIVAPLGRAQPPLFLEWSMRENFHRTLGAVLLQEPFRLTKLEDGVNQHTGKQQIVAELEQVVQGLKINGRVGTLRIVNTLWAIEGVADDFLIALRYAELDGIDNRELRVQLKMMMDIVSSFELISDGGDNVRREAARLADERYELLRAETLPKLFERQLLTALFRLRGGDLDTLTGTDKSLDDLTRLADLAESAKLEVDEAYEDLFDALKAGDLDALREEIRFWTSDD